MAIVTKPSLLAMAERWPSGFVARQEIENFTGGVMTDKYISWLDLKGKGPKNRVRIGRKVAYAVKDLVVWLESRSEFAEVNGDEHLN